MTAPSLNVNVTNEDESKHIIVHKRLSNNFSTDVRESKRKIVNKTLSQNYSTDVDEICYTDIDISEYIITEQKDAEYKEPWVTKEVKRYFNIFECGRNLLDRLDVTYQQDFMATLQDKYYTRWLDDVVKMNNCNGETLSNENLRQSASYVKE